MERILFTPRTRIVVAQKCSLSTIAPSHQRRKGARLSRRGFSGLCCQLLGQSPHHEDECIQTMDAVRTQPGARPECGRIAKFGLVEYRLSKSPAGSAGARTNRGEGFCEPAIKTAGSDEPLPAREFCQLARLCVAGSHGLLNEQMLALLQRQQSIFIVQLRAAKNVHSIDVCALEGRDSVTAVLQKAKFAPRRRRAFALDVANERQDNVASVAQSRKDR
jgi:hypothetical protein